MATNVFLSATFSDLIKERLEVMNVFRRLRVVNGLDVNLVTMEDFGFSPDRPISHVLKKLEECQAYICLIGFRYGSVPRGGKYSYTHREYKKAHQLGLPVFVLQKTKPESAAEIERDPGRLTLLNELRDHAREHHTVIEFESVDSMGKTLAQFLPKQIREHFPEIDLEVANGANGRVKYFQMSAITQPLIFARSSPVSLDVTAVSGFGFFYYSQTIEQFLAHGCSIRVLPVKDNGRAVELISDIAGKIEIGDSIRSSKQKAARIRDRARAERLSGTLEVREIDWLPSCALVIFDSGSTNPVGWVGTYTPDFSTSSREKWFVELNYRDNKAALDFHINQFERLWAQSHLCI